MTEHELVKAVTGQVQRQAVPARSNAFKQVGAEISSELDKACPE